MSGDEMKKIDTEPDAELSDKELDAMAGGGFGDPHHTPGAGKGNPQLPTNPDPTDGDD